MPFSLPVLRAARDHPGGEFCTAVSDSRRKAQLEKAVNRARSAGLRPSSMMQAKRITEWRFRPEPRQCTNPSELQNIDTCHFCEFDHGRNYGIEL